jgi:ribosomal protein S18 acetylase RimI-like enzyme
MINKHLYSIRPARISDAPAIALLHAESWRVAYRGSLSDEFLELHVVEDRTRVWHERFTNPAPTQIVLVAEREQSSKQSSEQSSEQEHEQLVGFICAIGKRDERFGTLVDNLHVRRGEQNNGIGRLLMSEVALWSRQHYPNDGIYLHVVEQNLQARKFYERLGATFQESPPWHAPDGSTVQELLCVWRTLDPLLIIHTP